MNHLRVLTLNGASLDDSSLASLIALAPDIVAVTEATASAIAAFAGARGMRSTSMTTAPADGETVAVLWRSDIAVDSTDRFALGQNGAAASALRISFLHAGDPVSVFCARLSADPAMGVGQQARLGGLIDATRGAVLAACENVCAQVGVRWSRCGDAWLGAQRRFLGLPPHANIGLLARSAFGLAPHSPLTVAAQARGPAWYCSDEFSVLESRSIAAGSSGDTALRFADVALKSVLNDPHVAVAL
jgi:hypothetical protein